MSLRSAILGGGNGVTRYANVSDEEADLMLQTGMEDLSDAQLIDDQLSRLEDTAVGLEGLVEVCDSITEAKPSELMLVESATELALAGTGARPEEVVPGLESAEGTVVSTEGIKDVIANIWKTIKDFLKKMWKKVTSFFHKIFGAVPKLRKQAEALKKRAETCQGKTAEETKIELGSLANVLQSNGRPCPSGKILNDSMKTYVEISNAMMGEYTKGVATAGDAIATAMKDFDPTADNDITTLNAISTASDKVAAGTKTLYGRCTKPMTGKRFDEMFLPKGLDLLHARTMVVQASTKSEVAAGEAAVAADDERGKSHAVARAISGWRISIVPTAEKDEDALTDGEMDNATPYDCVELADHIMAICDSIEKFTGGKSLKDIIKTKEKLQKATDKKSAEVEKKKDVPTEAMPSWRLAAGFNTAYARWATGPQSMWQSHAITVARAALSAANKSLSQYK